MSNRRKMAQNCWNFGSLPQPLPKGKGFSNFNMMFRAGFCVGFGRRCVGFWTLAV